jgi:hypothetical protein
MVLTGSSTKVLTGFSRGLITPIKTPNGSLSFNRIDENGDNNYDLIVLKSYGTIIAYRWIGSDIIYYRPYIQKYPNDEKLSKQDMKYYRYCSNTTSNHMGKLFNYINSEIQNNNREFNFVMDTFENNNEYEFINPNN